MIKSWLANHKQSTLGDCTFSVAASQANSAIVRTVDECWRHSYTDCSSLMKSIECDTGRWVEIFFQFYLQWLNAEPRSQLTITTLLKWIVKMKAFLCSEKVNRKLFFLCVFWTKTELISQKTFRSLLSWAALKATHVIMQMLPAACDSLRKVGSEINVTDCSK